MKIDKNDLGKCGIYCIQNIVNKKIYIGKSKNIYARIRAHIFGLRKKIKDENRHLINAWEKYGEDKFEYFVLEYLEINEELLKERELFWMKQYDSTNREKGYNLRMDSSTNMIVHEETKKLLSLSQSGENNGNYGHKWSDEQKQAASKKFKELYANGLLKANPEAGRKGALARVEKFKNNPELLESSINKVRKKISKYKIYQYTKDDKLVKVWDYINDIIKENPTYKKHSIYAVCSGEKPTMYGYKWVKVLNDNIVQTELKDSD